MDVSQQGPSGDRWKDVEFIMKTCLCSRLRAVSALKSSKGDRNAAVRSLTTGVMAMREPAPSSLPPVREHALDENNAPASLRIPSPAPTQRLSAQPPRIEAPTLPRSVSPRSVSPRLPRSPSPSSPRLLPPGSSSSHYQIPEVTPSRGSTPISRPESAQKIPDMDILPFEMDLPPPYEKFLPDPELLKPSVFPKDEKSQFCRRTSRGSSLEAGPSQPARSHSHLDLYAEPERENVHKDDEWNFQLPAINVAIDEPEFSPDEGKHQQFSLRRLISGLQSGIPHSKVVRYLSFFSVLTVRRELARSLEGFPSIFYAVATNDEKIVRTWAEQGGDVNAVEPRTGTPLLPFAILRTHAVDEDTTAVVMTLLSIGANTSVIPRVMYTPCTDDPIDRLPFDHRYPDFQETRKSWCKPWVSTQLATACNLTQRYFLQKTSQNKGPSHREVQVAEAHDATALLRVSHFLIGQTLATKLVSQKLLSHMALPRSKPLVLAFTGPSGHGKTELAKRLGELLNLEIERIDCTEMRYETDLFGPKKPYIGHELGSPLNNFLARFSGKRCIVFLDEFEKTTRDVQNALLIPFDEGKYVDRRNRGVVDCTKTIWVLATNAVDNIILDFSEAHREELLEYGDSLRQADLVADLTMRINKQLKSEFGNPLTGRLSVTIPFLPFSSTEAAVVTHKFVLELKRRVKQTISVSSKQLVGHVVLELRRDGAICKLIADEGYDMDQGARSLRAAVESRIGDELVRTYLEEEGQINDDSPLVKYAVDLGRDGSILVLKGGVEEDEERRVRQDEGINNYMHDGRGAGGHYQDISMLSMMSGMKMG